VNRIASSLCAVDFHYNAWGGKYPPFDDDQQVARRVAGHIGCQHLPVDLCLEGGALEIDEQGVMMCTRTCAFDDNRNHGISPEEIERRIIESTGATAMIWLEGDCLVGDDTDGHIDQLARFTPKGPILYAWTDEANDPQQAGLKKNLDDLRAGLERLAIQRDLVPLPVPDPVFFRNVQIPACYCNYYLTNDSVIVPSFGVRQDDVAGRMIAELHAERRLVVLPSNHLTVGLGSFHCLTQQQPAL
jgi:agmatine deiminase